MVKTFLYNSKIETGGLINISIEFALNFDWYLLPIMFIGIIIGGYSFVSNLMVVVICILVLMVTSMFDCEAILEALAVNGPEAKTIIQYCDPVKTSKMKHLLSLISHH